MELRHEFTVPVPVEEAWRALLDIERVAPCLPGTTVQEFDGEKVNGTVKVKVGPVTLTYRGTAVFEERDEAAHRMVLRASGKEVRGQGTARATVTAGLTASGEGTAVSVHTDFAVTGRPAQIGRGVMAEVGDKLVGRFADCLAGELVRTPGAEAGTGTAAGEGRAAGATAAAEPGGPSAPPGGTSAEVEPGGPAPAARAEAGPAGAAAPIDLVRTAGLPVARRIVPAALAAGAAAAAVAVIVRRRRH
ncbi:SRPBCC family protein [Streptomyces wuyuanensis]|uniref:Carbon monoxide dehydrogenase subunit G n=1 Tax=Streptomyces wuyuanensis TaxID=1196353 RepID=A0A1G9Z0C7_9ACTN|nr:SRPBCC family protein [Streptomyces wuyuanensis]SDN14859.1 Carbon monoxide dehydrogenase subunit G [Streptomyces wuyuanensis]